MKIDILKKHSVRYILAIFICGMLSLIMISVVLGRQHRLKKIPDKGKNFGCGTCHFNPKGGGKRNPFGKDYRKIGLKAKDNYTDELGELDSDGDGFTNDQEFDAGTHPGDTESKPADDEAPAGDEAQIELKKALEIGKTLFNDKKLGETKKSCNDCHLYASPQSQDQKLAKLRWIINPLNL